MIRPEVLDAMVAAGCSAEQIAAAVKASIRADMAAAEARRAAKREGNAERQRRFRNALSRVTDRDEALSPPPPPLVSPVPPSETSPRSAPKGASLPPGECAGDAREIALRRQICAAFEAVGRLPPAMHMVGVWLSRGYAPDMIAEIVTQGVRRGGVTTLAYFEKVLPKEHARMQAPEARPPPETQEPANVTPLRKRQHDKPSVLDIGRSLIDRPPPGAR